MEPNARLTRERAKRSRYPPGSVAVGHGIATQGRGLRTVF